MSEPTRRIEIFTFLAALILVTGFFFYSIKTLLIPIFYGAVIAIVLYPLYLRLNISVKDKKILSAILTIFIAFFCLVVLFGSIGGFVAKDALVLVEDASHNVDSLAPKVVSAWNNVKDYLPDSLAERFSSVNLREQIINVVRSVGTSIFNSLQSLAGNLVRVLGLSIVTFYATFYFLVNGQRWLQRLSDIMPLPGREERYLADKFMAMVRTSLKMVFVMGAVQGFLGGLVFFLLGIGTPFFWGIIFALLSLIPGLGHYVIWIPAALILAVTGAPVKAVILVLYGLFILATSDDFLRPYLVGKTVRIHPFLVFIATIGGITTFGFTGLILGPVLAALTLAFWELFERRYSLAN